MERTSITSRLTPRFSRICAALIASTFIHEVPTTVMSLPGRSTRAPSSPMPLQSSGTSPTAS